MIISLYKKNLAHILSIAAIIIVFTKAQDVIINNLGWLLFFVITIVAMSYVVDNIYNHFWMKHSISGKLYLAAKQEKDREAINFGNELIDANKNAVLTGDWSKYIELINEKNKQVERQNVLLLNRWLKSQFGKF